MKKLISVVCMISIMLAIPAIAGDVPEALLHSDEAKLFFAELVSYHPDSEDPYVEFSPVKIIKGDVSYRKNQTARNFNIVGDYNLKQGEIYLFTYFDQNNPSEIFEVSSYDTATLRLKNVSGNMWERFEKYINEGRYEKANHQRLDELNNGFAIEGEDISLAELIGVERKDAKKVSVDYTGRIYELDVEAFYDAIEDIALTDIENVLPESQNGTVTLEGMYIMVNDSEGYAYITDDCKVDKHTLFYSRLPVGKYAIKSADRARITALIEEQELENYSAKKPSDNAERKNVVVPVTALALSVGAFAIAFFVGKSISKGRK